MDYKRHPVYVEYLLYEDGTIFSDISNKFLIPQDNGNGYLKVTLHGKGCVKPVQRYIHILMLESWVGDCPVGHSVDHINRNKKDNHISNLRYVLFSENTKNTANLPRYGVKRSFKFLTTEEKFRIITLYSQGYKVMQISKITKISRQSVSRIIKQSSH